MACETTMCMHDSAPETLDIRPARSEDTRPLSLMLAQAFHQDPVYCWLFPREATRIQKCQRLFAVFLSDLIAQGSVFVTENMEGAALWISPRQVGPGWRGRVKQSAQVSLILGTGTLHGIQWQLTVESKHPRYRHWYLFLLGIAPERQGQGIGSALLQPMLERCDTERLPIYLNTSNMNNVPFYQRRGFEIVEETALSAGPTVSHMVREPGG